MEGQRSTVIIAIKIFLLSQIQIIKCIKEIAKFGAARTTWRTDMPCPSGLPQVWEARGTRSSTHIAVTHCPRNPKKKRKVLLISNLVLKVKLYAYEQLRVCPTTHKRNGNPKALKAPAKHFLQALFPKAWRGFFC